MFTLILKHISDEETGGFNGIIPFIDTKAFQALNAGFFFDEGIASPDDTVYVSYQDKRPFREYFFKCLSRYEGKRKVE